MRGETYSEKHVPSILPVAPVKVLLRCGYELLAPVEGIVCLSLSARGVERLGIGVVPLVVVHGVLARSHKRPCRNERAIEQAHVYHGLAQHRNFPSEGSQLK